MERIFNGVTIDCVVGDITQQTKYDAVVNAANAELLPGAGVAGAIHRAAGPGLAAECRALAPLRPGQAVITSGYDLPNRHVIHVLGPRYGLDEPSAELLASSYRDALRVADERGAVSIAFPAISTGVFGYPMEEAADVALAAVVATVGTLKSVRFIRLVLRDQTALRFHERALEDEWTQY